MEHPQIRDRRRAALAVLCLSLVVIAMDNTILNVALPTLARELVASGSELQWTVDAYVLVFAGLLLSMGSLGDRFGRRLMLQLGLVIFGLGSLGSALAASATVLIAMRAVMGVGAALIMPSTLSIITNVFTDARERGRAIGAWAGVAGFGIVLGPVIGGWLLEDFWWGSVFMVNLPVVVVALGLGMFLVPESRDPMATPLDPTGALLSIAALTALVYGIIEAPGRGWTDGLILACFGAALVLTVAFIGWEFRAPHPMLQIGFFRDLRFAMGAASIMLVFFALLGGIFVLTQYLQFVLGYSPLEAGLRVTPVGAVIIGAPLGSRLVERIGSKVVVAGGMVLVAAALTLLSFADQATEYWVIATALAMFGFGMGATTAPATECVMGSLPLAKAGVGSAMNDTTRLVGAALGVAVVGSVLSSLYSSSVEAATVGLPVTVAAAAGDSIGSALGVSAGLGAAGVSLAEAARAAFIDGMSGGMLTAAAVALVGTVLVSLFLPAGASRVEGHETERAGLGSAS
ncbi:MAG: DHA2 family efflux MFS transporter permease subunit [Actinomycetota bacterium]